jgi:DNA replication protein DnaC
LVGAGVSKKYWEFEIEHLLDKYRQQNSKALSILQKYMEKIETMTAEGVGLYIQGTAGLAKSALGSLILRQALQKGIECYCIRMSQLTKLLFDALKDEESRNKLTWLYTDVQLLMVDEIEKDYKMSDTTTFSGTQVNEFFGEIYNRQKSLIVTSGNPKKGLRNIHADNVIDRLEELVDVHLIGESYRKQSESLKKILD